MVCRRCGEEGHVVASCTAEPACNLCGERGHMYSKCPGRVRTYAQAVSTKPVSFEEQSGRVERRAVSVAEPLGGRGSRVSRERVLDEVKVIDRAGDSGSEGMDVVPETVGTLGGESGEGGLSRTLAMVVGLAEASGGVIKEGEGKQKQLVVGEEGRERMDWGEVVSDEEKRGARDVLAKRKQKSKRKLVAVAEQCKAKGGRTVGGDPNPFGVLDPGSLEGGSEVGGAGSDGMSQGGSVGESIGGETGEIVESGSLSSVGVVLGSGVEVSGVSDSGVVQGTKHKEALRSTGEGSGISKEVSVLGEWGERRRGRVQVSGDGRWEYALGDWPAVKNFSLVCEVGFQCSVQDEGWIRLTDYLERRHPTMRFEYMVSGVAMVAVRLLSLTKEECEAATRELSEGLVRK
ncbi:ZCHC3 protein, partial [Atractosteus spatula]|nr:ZCHC3 protein [Atractosteus spatula]